MSIKAVCFFFPDIYMYNRKMSFIIIVKIGQWCRNCKSRQYRDHISGTVWWSHEYQREVITYNIFHTCEDNTFLIFYQEWFPLFLMEKKSYDVMTISNGILYILFLKMIDKNRFGLDLRNLEVKCNYERYLFSDNQEMTDCYIDSTYLVLQILHYGTSVYYSILKH